MKLYELIELGSTLIDECHYAYFERDESRCVGCALTTAFAAIHELPEEFLCASDIYDLLAGHIGARAARLTECPQCTEGGAGLLAIVDHLHATHDWPRQRIAEWLKPIEDAWEAEQKTKEPATVEAQVHAG